MPKKKKRFRIGRDFDAWAIKEKGRISGVYGSRPDALNSWRSLYGEIIRIKFSEVK